MVGAHSAEADSMRCFMQKHLCISSCGPWSQILYPPLWLQALELAARVLQLPCPALYFSQVLSKGPPTCYLYRMWYPCGRVQACIIWSRVIMLCNLCLDIGLTHLSLTVAKKLRNERWFYIIRPSHYQKAKSLLYHNTHNAQVCFLLAELLTPLKSTCKLLQCSRNRNTCCRYW